MNTARLRRFIGDMTSLVSGAWQDKDEAATVEVGSKLPVRFEAYDAPKASGGEGELLEMQGVVGLKLNVGLGERDFDR